MKTLNCSGLCLPMQPGSTVDVLQSLSTWACAKRALELLDAGIDACSPKREDERRLLRALGDFLKSKNACYLTQAFDHPLAQLDTPPDGGFLASENLCSETERALSICRAIIGVATNSSIPLIILPPSARLEEGLYLPHIHALIRSDGGPIAVRQFNKQLRITWSDGTAATIPLRASLPAGKVLGGRLFLGFCAGPVPVLNCVPEIRALFNSLGLASEEEVAEEATVFTKGLLLLGQVWPAAYSAARRQLRGVLLLSRRNHVRSHSDPRLPGVFLTTADSPIQVADTLCHELSHSRMNLFLERDPMLIDDGEACHPSPWRPDPRPLMGILNGVHAFLNVCHFYRRIHAIGEEAVLADEIFSNQKEKVKEGFKLLSEHASPTELGAIFLAELEKEVEALG